MKSRKWLILLLVIVTMMSLATYTGATRSVFLDDELSTDDTLRLFVPQVVLDDGFEDTPGWDANWDDYGPTDWIQDTTSPHTGTYRAFIDNAHTPSTPGYLTSDDLDAAGTTIIYVSFWFNLKSLEAGDCELQIYDGSEPEPWTTWYDLLDYPTYANNVWCQFNEEITDLQSQYFIGNFKIRFDASALGDSTEQVAIDDVLISTFDSIPVAPTGLVATLGDTEVSLDWDDNSEGDLDGYNVYRSESMGGPYTKVNGSLVATSDYTDTGLTNDVTYYYVVTAVDFGSNESDYSNEDSATPTDLPPAAPTGLVATSGNEEINLDWNDNSEGDLDGYNVYRSESMGGPYSKVNGSLVASSDYNDTELTYDVTYYFVVTAVDLTSNESGDSNEDSAVANNIAPAAPTGLVATPGDKEVSLDWNDNTTDPDLDGYNVYRSLTSGSGYSKINGGLVTASDYDDTGLTNGVDYYYVVTAVDTYAAESGDSNKVSATPVNAPPAAPTGLAATPDNAEIRLNWNDNSEGDLDGYNVYRTEAVGGGPPYTKVNGSLVALSEYTDTGLINNDTYYYVVTAVDTEDEPSVYSNEASATPVAPVFLNDGFEGDPWDDNWNNNEPTTWIRDAGNPNSGTYNAMISNSQTPGNLTSDDIDASALNDININFWFNLKSLEAGDCKLQLDDGSDTWTTEYDLTSYPTYVNNTWCPFSEVITDSQYFVSNFRIRFNASALGGTTEEANIDDVLIITDSIPPAVPIGLGATLGDTEVSLDWSNNTEVDLDGYNVYRSVDTGGPYSQVNVSLVETNEYTDTGLTNDVTYYYVVTAVDFGSKESDYSSEVSATPTDLPPAAPTGLVATAGDEEISLDWNDNTEGDIDGYNIYRSETPDGPYTTPINASLVALSEYTDTGLYGGGTYYYVVRAVDLTSNESVDSNEDSATANDVAPAAPTGLGATPGDRQASLVWDVNSEDDIDGYNVYRSEAMGGPYSKVNVSLVALSEYTDTGLTGGVTYYYVVTALDLADPTAYESGYSNEDSTIPTDAPPSAPTGLGATPGDRQASLVWDVNSEDDIDGYNVYRSEAMGGPYSKVNVSLVATNNYNDTGLTGGVTYYYVVTAVDLGSNESGYSDEASAIPTDAPPSAPTGLGATPGGEQISLNWDDNSEDDIDGYNVYRKPEGGSYSQINVSLVALSEYTDTGLYGGGTYYYVVTAVDDGANESGNSNEATATATDVAPAAPTGLVATPGEAEISLDWNDNSEDDIDGYNVYRSLTTGEPYNQINVGLVATNSYTDTFVIKGVPYYYVVIAVDWASNESNYSNEDSARLVEILLDDGFEGTPWDDNWDGNGKTTWTQDSSKPNSGTYKAHISNKGIPGSLTSDDLNTFAAENITVSFWFNLKGLEADDCVLQIYNGSTWTTWYDLLDYPTYVNNVWCQFIEVIEVETDSQYFISDFRIMFDSSLLGDSTEEANIDDVLIAINK